MISRRRSQINVILFGLAIAAFASFQQFKLPVVLPVLLENYGYERTLAGGLMSIYALIGLLSSVLFARFVSRHGALRPLSIGLGLFVLGNLLGVIWPQFAWMMLLSRALEGLGFAVAALIGPILVNANASPRHLPIVAGFTAAWIPIGQLVASFLAPVFLHWSGWQGLWWFAAFASLGFMIWAITLHRGDPNIFIGKPDILTNKKQLKGNPSAQLIPFVATGAIFMFWAAQYFAYMTWLPQFLTEQHNLPLADATLSYIVPVSLVMAFCIATGGLLRIGVPLTWLLVCALTLQATVWWLLPIAQTALTGLVSLVVYGASAGLTAGCLFALPSFILGSGQRTAVAFGIIMTGRNIGVLIGPLLIAWTFSYIGTWELASPVFGAVTTACLPCAAVLIFTLRRANYQATQIAD